MDHLWVDAIARAALYGLSPGQECSLLVGQSSVQPYPPFSLGLGGSRQREASHGGLLHVQVLPGVLEGGPSWLRLSHPGREALQQLYRV